MALNPPAMKLEHKILEFLRDHYDGNFSDVSMISDDYQKIKEAVTELKGNNLIVIEDKKPRNFEAFGIPKKRPSRINVKINTRGREYLYALKNSKKGLTSEKRSFWKLAYFFG